MNIEQPCCRILQDLNSGTHFRQIPTYAYKEIAQIHREIAWRFSELKQILAHQKKALEALIQHAEDYNSLPEDCLTIVEYPYFALWIHVSAVQQLKRSLHIYKHQRMKWIYQIALNCFFQCDGTTHTLSQVCCELESRLSRPEKEFLYRLYRLISRYGNAMGAVISAETERNFNFASKAVFENVHVYIPDATFRENLSKLDLTASHFTQNNWSFENVVLPRVDSNVPPDSQSYPSTR